MGQKIKAFCKSNRFVLESFKEYRKFSTSSEKVFDLLFALLIALGLTIIPVLFFNVNIKQFINNFQTLNNIVITAISILAGFNVASIAVIASSQSDVIRELKNKPSEKDPKTSKFSILVIFFTWAIVVQLIIVLIGILLYFASQFFVPKTFKNDLTPYWLWTVFVMWLAGVLHSIFISIRNVKMLYLFIVKGV
ncbi:hypothetical protein [Fictibacillus gelatini]|uniref:hypothetical protein n=1 Tax=Fictibacillus gelatini TaxID=225985 RepID=UPI000426234A|nr:hypothetical protein [Fictibacillus gelatini]